MFFPSFGTILVLVAAFVYKKTTKNAKNTKRIPFPTFLITVFLIFQFFYIHVYSCLFVCFIKFRKNRGSKYEVQQGMVPFWGI